MTDREQTSDDKPEIQGGWHDPSTPFAWREPPQKEEFKGWTVPALPVELEEAPAESGAWHLPSPEDTVFTAEDEIEVSSTSAGQDASSPEALLSPEEMIAQIMGQKATTEEAIPEADEDELPLVDEADDEAFSMSEFLALQSLTEEGEPEVAAPVEDLQDMTPAERALFDVASVASEELPQPQVTVEPASPPSRDDDASVNQAEDYARQMLQQLHSEGVVTDSDVTTRLDDAEQSDILSPEGKSAAEIAAEMAAKFAEDEPPIAVGATPVPYQTEVYDPQLAALAQQYRDTQEKVASLRQMYHLGQISQTDFQEQLRQHMVLDSGSNIWWMMGAETDTWYKYENNDWVQDIPPALQHGTSAPQTGYTDVPYEPPLPPLATGGVAQPQVTDPYGERTGYAPDDYGATQTDNYFVPGQAPTTDPQHTVVGPSAFQDELIDSQATIPSQAATYQPTVPSTPVQDQYSPIESAVGYDEPPSYDIDTVDSDLYDQYAVEERSSTARKVAIAGGILVGLVIVAVIGVIVIAMLWYESTVSPWRDEITALAVYEPPFNTARILDADGNLIVELNSQEGGARTPVSLDEMSPYIIHAVVSVENKRFYEDPGFDVAAILRAFIQNLTAGEIESGASTITQQVARNLVLQDTEVTASRKVNEILVAMEIANNYDKNFVLELYLNEVFFGNQSYGVESASQFYFKHGADDLNLAESALLASIIQAPATNDPVVNRPNAVLGMQNAIRLMIDAGCLQFQHGDWLQRGPFCVGSEVFIDYQGTNTRMLSLDDSGNVNGGPALLWITDVELGDYKPRDVQLKYPHFVNYIQGQVEDIFGPSAMFQRGFTIHTTLIPHMQDAAEDAVAIQVGNMLNTGINTGAVMVTDPRTGAIRAMVGSHDFSDEEAGQVNNTIQWHQPGSSIKPVVYAAALEGAGDGQYLTPVSILWDVPSSYQINEQVYNPINYDRRYHGPRTVRHSLQNSYNVAAVKAYSFIGNDKFLDMASRLGLQFLQDSSFNLPSALGANEVRLIDMMESYGTLANNGQHVELYAIERITEIVDGQDVEVLLEPRAEPRQVVAPQVAYLMQNILSDDLARAEQFSTGTTLTLERLGIPTLDHVAAKTGTTDNGRDLWTMGFTSNTVVGVWLGTHDDSPTFNTTGFLAASPVWNAVMEAAIRGRAVTPFPNPGAIVRTVCRTTGTLEFDTCPERINELFINNQFPPPPEDGFVQTIEIDSWTGLRANQWCQENKVQQVFADIEDPFAVSWLRDTAEGRAYAQSVGLPDNLISAPTGACQQGMSLPTVHLNNPTQGQQLTGTATITGQVFAADFSSYELAYAPVSSPESFQQITSATNQFQNAGSTLAMWDTTSVPNGQYLLQLKTNSVNNGFINRTVQIEIANTQPTATPTQPAILLPTTIPSGGVTPIPFDSLNPTVTPGG